jgi:hypothetical protein
MSEQDIKNNSTPEGESPEGLSGTNLEGGTYEIIKNRLLQHGKELKNRLEQLNVARKDVFGSIETTLLCSERIITRNNCVPRDMVPLNSGFIFGYNVHLGLKSKVELEDVFAIYEYENKQFREVSLEMIQDKKFVTEYQELYKFYKLTHFVKFSIIGPYLYMIFRVGRDVTDIKAFKWLIEEGGKLTYVDSRSDHEIKFPPQHDFEWKRTRREDHRTGLHPHISIEDRVFVETIEGDLTIKVEDNTDSGMGLYAEEVEDKDQGLDDAEIYYASVGNLILLKIRPYQENDFRHFVFNEKLHQVNRIDTIKDSCILLPDNHGLIFPNGYYLQSGEYKTFDISMENMLFEQRVAAPNGEDYQYFFYNRDSGTYMVLSYNLIAQTVDTPIVCNGFSHFHNGEMIIFKSEPEPRKNHTVQIWQTPFVDKDYVPETDAGDSFLFQLGNQDIVRCMADCQSVINLVRKEESYVNLYVDIEKGSSDIIDSYFWLDKEEAFNLREVLAEIRTTAASAVEEYEKVVRIKKSTRKQIGEVKEKAGKQFKEISYASFDAVNDYVEALAQLRGLRGEIISLKDLRYTDFLLIDSLETEVKAKNEVLSGRCVEFLLKPEGLDPYRNKVNEQGKSIPTVNKGSEGKLLEEEITKTAGELELLIDIVSNLKIEDPTQTTEIIDRISTIYASLNQNKSKLGNRMKELRQVEGEAEFNSQMKLINQAVVNYLGVSDTPEKCEEYLTKVMVQLEELEGKFADFEEFIPQLSEKREELYSAFESKRLSILEKRNKRGNALLKAAERILNGLKNRLDTFTNVTEINGYFASDLMVEKVRDIVEQLLEMGDTVKADDIQGRMKTIREDAVRQLKDKQDLFVEGKNIIKFGNHNFTVNTQHLELSMVQRDDQLYFHMTGTDFWQPVDSQELADLHSVWDQETLSENRDVYRSEYLAYQILTDAVAGKQTSVSELAKLGDEELLGYVQKFMGPRYREAYTKGLHDQDAAIILRALLTMHQSIDLLVYGPNARALAVLYWKHDNGTNDAKEMIHKRLKGLNKVARIFKGGESLDNFIHTVETEIENFVDQTGLFSRETVPESAKYLCRELMRGDRFVISSEADESYKGFIQQLKEKRADIQFSHSLDELSGDLSGAFFLVQEWLLAHFRENPESSEEGKAFMAEICVMLLTDSYNLKNVIDVKTSQLLEGLNGDHSVIQQGKYPLSYSAFMDKLKYFDENVVPRYMRYQELKKSVTEAFKDRLRLEEFKSRVLSSFVRNKLIDKVYLPLIGDNLAKQMGTAGESKRTDLMGMLLLISPPGYGKTTLMEYIADRLGIIFVKINGPAIGHQVTSLDPAEASNTGAREEVKKLNLAFEMGNNIMIYVDDIQHCNPEFLQKFISLCDAQRKIEGIYNGVGKTYDLRGKKVAVVMAGNPYTESGEKFKIPDMLANRADVYNLGDMLRENEEAFKLSYIENSLTSNPVLNKLITRSRNDVYSLIEVAQGIEKDSLDLEGNYSAEEVNEFVTVIKKLFRVRNVVLDINMEYIRSAAQADEYRTEPPFKMQGSYRNMNRIAEKVLPVMNDEELESLIEGNYENDSQTLTSGAEANMLKWKEIAGRLTDENKRRWDEIKKTYGKNKLVKSDDKVGQVILQLSEFKDGLGGIKDVISNAAAQQANMALETREAQLQEVQKAKNEAEEKIKEQARQLEKQKEDEQNQAQPNFLEGVQHITEAIARGFGSLETAIKHYAERVEAGTKSAPSISNGDLMTILSELKNAIASGITVTPTVAASAVPVERVVQVKEVAVSTVSPATAPPEISDFEAPEPVPVTAEKKTTTSKPSQQPPPVPPQSQAPPPPPVPEMPPEVPKISDTKITQEIPVPPVVNKTPKELEVAIENFRVISKEMARRLVDEKTSLAEANGINFGNDFSLRNASIEGFGNDRVLMLIWECLRDASFSKMDKLLLSLMKDGKNIWNFETDFRTEDNIYKKGDFIYGRIRLENQTFRVADHLGIRIKQLMMDNKWYGIKVEGDHPKDLRDHRLLVKLEFRHKY